jgi:hypothetical protein
MDDKRVLRFVHMDGERQVSICFARAVKTGEELGARRKNAFPVCLREKWLGKRKGKGHTEEGKCSCARCYTDREYRKVMKQSVAVSGGQ